jgi:hypothetical protein
MRQHTSGMPALPTAWIRGLDSKSWLIETYVLRVVQGSLSLCIAIRLLRAVQGSLPFFIVYVFTVLQQTKSENLALHSVESWQET